MTGITAAALGAAQPAMISFAALAGAAGLASLIWRDWDWPREALLLSLSALLGAVCHARATTLPAHHIARLVSDEPLLARAAGVVASAPVVTPPTLRNPFVREAPRAVVSFLLEVEELGGEPRAPVCGLARVSVSATSLPLEPGARVEVTGWLRAIRAARNPGDVDWAERLALEGVRASLFANGAEQVRLLNAPVGLISRLRAELLGAARMTLNQPFADDPDEDVQGLLDAAILGQRDRVGRVLNEAFLRTGSIHFLSVSGFHVGLLGFLIWTLARRVMRCGEGVSAGFTALALLAYALLAEPNAPILRATITGLCFCAARLLRRPYSPLAWLSGSAVLILLIDPRELFRAGFQLSFVQMLALTLIVPYGFRTIIHRPADDQGIRDVSRWRDWLRLKIASLIVGAALISVVAWSVSAPLVAHHFGRIGLWAPLQSTLLAPLLVGVTLLGFAQLLVGWLPGLGLVIGAALRGVTDALLASVDWLARAPGALVDVTPLNAVQTLGLYGLLIAAWLFWRRSTRVPAEPGAPRTKTRAIAMVWLLPAPLVWLVPQWVAQAAARSDVARLTVLSVGAGSAALLISGSHAAMFDAGTLSNTDAGEIGLRAMRAEHISRLEGLFISHGDSDHFSGAPAVAGVASAIYFSPHFLPRAAHGTPEAKLLSLLPEPPPGRKLVEAGHELSLGRLRLEALWPPAELPDRWSANDSSLVLRASAAGRHILLPGDVESDAMKGLLEAHEAGEIDLRSDVLVAPHHGAFQKGITRRFYETVEPELVIISSNKPREELQQMIHEALGPGRRVLNTRDVGAVRVRILPDGRLLAETPFSERPRRD